MQIRWDGKNRPAAPEKWRLAMQAVPHLGLVYTHLAFPGERQEFLGLVFTSHGVRVAAGGSISQVNLKLGFVRI